MEAVEKLYDEDSYLRRFTARVLSCQWDEKRACYGVKLNRTAFFPEEGGQYADTGILGGIPVEDVRERGGQVIHYLKQPLKEGEEVWGEVDDEDRFSKMQQHTGEHIVSGLVHRHFGYDNVGFHLGKELVTMDFNGTLTEPDVRLVEREANRATAANLKVLVTYPTREELERLDYRSKKELTGQVRIVTVPGYDVCACCAPHVARTGEIGMIKLIDAVKYKGGTRVTMVCGFRALGDYQMKENNIREISRLLSAKPCGTAEAVKRLQGEVQQWKDRMVRLQVRYLQQRLEEIPQGAEHFLLFEPDLEKNGARRFADEGMDRCSGICGIFIGSETDGYQYILGSRHLDMRGILKDFHQRIPGKGGGRPEMVQGTVPAGISEADIRQCLCGQKAAAL